MRARDLWAVSLPLAMPMIVATAGCHIVLGLDKATISEGGGGTGGDGGAGGTGGTTIDPGCIPSQTPNPIGAECAGVFVSSSRGNDANEGSREEPFATIAKALGSAKEGPIYLCAETFEEAVQIKAGETIYGGLDCANGWAWVGGTKKTEISPAPGAVPLVLDPGVEAKLEDVTLRAKDAVEAGGSSIAVIATAGSELSLSRCDIEAGNGEDGTAGEAFASDAPGGAMGNPGAEACTAGVVVGGESVTNACDEADANDDSISGSGGVGQAAVGSPGGPGTPLGTMNGGTGQLDDAGMCTAGTVGDPGAPGTAGTGARGMGAITAQGYAGPAGGPGEKGKPGQGGGGGGGAKGGAVACTGLTGNGGASGGSGGSGGCGGAGGKGGQAGGSSIGVIALGTKLTFSDVKITTKNGGKGGAGGTGQNGGTGGPGGAGGSKGATTLKAGCAGGPGGNGGAGGKGGGGLGGHSIGIAFMGDAPDVNEDAITTGVAAGGGNQGEAGEGAAGVTGKVVKF